MSVFANNILEEQEALQEASLFISSSGKELKKMLKEKFKEEYTKGIGNRLKNNIKATSDYDKEKAKNAAQFVLSKLNKGIACTNYIYTISYDGVSEDYYRQNFYGFYKENFYKIILDYSPNGVYLVSLNELDMKKCIMPEDVILDCINAVKNKRYNPNIGKNKITFESLGREEKISDILEKIVDKFNKSHTDMEATFGKLTNSIIFKKKK